MSQKTVAVGTTEVPVSLDTNFGNAQDNFTELYTALAKETKWVAESDYTEDTTAVIHGGQLYVCILTHTSSIAGAVGNEPGIGTEWETYWVIGNITTDERSALANAQPDLGNFGVAGKYLVEETVLGLRSLYAPGTWKLFYTDGDGGGLKELSIGTFGHFLKSNGTGGAHPSALQV